MRRSSSTGSTTSSSTGATGSSSTACDVVLDRLDRPRPRPGQRRLVLDRLGVLDGLVLRHGRVERAHLGHRGCLGRGQVGRLVLDGLVLDDRLLDRNGDGSRRRIRRGRCVHDLRACGKVTEALTALARGEHHDQTHDVETDAVDHAHNGAHGDLAHAGRAAVGEHDTQLHQLLADGLAAAGLHGEVVVERPTEDHCDERAADLAAIARERIGGEQDHEAAGKHDSHVDESRQNPAVVELGTADGSCRGLCGGVHHRHHRHGRRRN